MAQGSVSAEELGRSNLLADLGQGSLEALASAADRRRMADNETLYEQGGEARELYIIVRGRLALHVSDGERSVMVQSLHAEDVLGWSALREAPHWLTTARALGPVEVVALPLSAVLDVFEAGGPDARRLAQRLFGIGAAHLDSIRAQLQPSGRDAIITGG